MAFMARIGFVLVVLLMAANPAARAQSTVETVDADIAACRQTSDDNACERAYDYLDVQRIAAEEILAADGKKRKKNKKAAKAKAPEEFHAELISLADTGCLAGNGWLCTELGWAYRKSTLGLAVDEGRSLAYYTRACELGRGYGCARQGAANELGLTIPVDRDAAERLYRRGCEMESSHACQYLADLLLWDRINTEPAAPEPIETLKSKCADTGLDGPSCLAIGIAYFRGSDGVAQDEDEAGKYFGKACGRAIYAPGCYYGGLRRIRSTDMTDRHSPDNLTAIQGIYRGCLLGDLPACEFMVMAGQSYAWDYQDVIAQGMYGRCLHKPSVEDCVISGNAFKSYKHPDNPIKGEYAADKAARAWLTACLEFNASCIDAANIHLGSEKFTAPSINLAIGILETACEKGDAASCTRRDEVVAEKGGVMGSYIDPMLPDDERFLLARFDIESGETQRGRETMQWLAFLGHTHAQLYLAYAYENGLDVAPRAAPGKVRDLPHTLMNKKENIYELFEAAARKGVPEAALKVAVIKYYENDQLGSDGYPASMGRALYLGAEGAAEFDAAVKAQNKARTEQQLAAIREMNRQNIESRDNMDRQTVQSAWDQYYKRQAERKEAEGGEVCGTVYGPGNSTYRTCMSRATAMKHYRGNF